MSEVLGSGATLPMKRGLENLMPGSETGQVRCFGGEPVTGDGQNRTELVSIYDW